MCLLSFLKWGSIGYSLGIVQWDFTRRDHPENPGRVSGSGPVRCNKNSQLGIPINRKEKRKIRKGKLTLQPEDEEGSKKTKAPKWELLDLR